MASNLFQQAQAQAKLLKLEYGIDYSAKVKGTIDAMANGYCDACDAGDERKKDLFISGLILRFWYVIKKMQEKSPNVLLTNDEFVDWLYDAIEYACKYRAWRKPDSKVNAQQAINQCIETIRKQRYYEFNLDKHKANYNTISLETPIGEDDKATIGDILADEEECARVDLSDGHYAARAMIQELIDKDKLVEAIILDTIAFDNSTKVNSRTVQVEDEDGKIYKVTRSSESFWPFKCIQSLNNLPEDYAKYFYKYYKVLPIKFEKALEFVRKANNQKLYQAVDNTLKKAKTFFGR